MPQESNTHLHKLISLLKENQKTIEIIHDSFDESNKEIFKANCLKDIPRCEPEFCSFRIDGSCKYIDKLEPLNDTKRKFNWELK